MIDKIRDLFRRHMDMQDATTDPEHALRLATGALLVEVAKADFDTSAVEEQTVRDLLTGFFSLTSEEVEELFVAAREESHNATCLFEFTRLVDTQYSPQQKSAVIGLLWRVAWSDGRLDGHEEHLVRKVADLLHVPHAEFIRQKLLVESES